MDKRKLVVQLAGRMGVAEEKAEEWLQAVMDVLHQAYVGDAVSDEHAQEQPINRSPSNQGLPVLRPLTRVTKLAIDDEVAVAVDRFPYRVGRYEVPLDRFPFRVGREGRVQTAAGVRGMMERRHSPAKKNNELYVKDQGKTVNVSREHFQIELKSDGSYELVDRGSACGTIVENQTVGGNYTGGRCPLNFGDSIIVGTPESTIVFEFSRVDQ